MSLPFFSILGDPPKLVVLPLACLKHHSKNGSTSKTNQHTHTHTHSGLLSCSVAPFFPFFLVAAPLKWSKPKEGFLFFPGSLNN